MAAPAPQHQALRERHHKGGRDCNGGWAAGALAETVANEVHVVLAGGP